MGEGTTLGCLCGGHLRFIPMERLTRSCGVVFLQLIGFDFMRQDFENFAAGGLNQPPHIPHQPTLWSTLAVSFFRDAVIPNNKFETIVYRNRMFWCKKILLPVDIKWFEFTFACF